MYLVPYGFVDMDAYYVYFRVAGYLPDIGTYHTGRKWMQISKRCQKYYKTSDYTHSDTSSDPQKYNTQTWHSASCSFWLQDTQ